MDLMLTIRSTIINTVVKVVKQFGLVSAQDLIG